VLNPRKLAAIDLVFLGAKVIIAEFAGGVLLCLGLGAFVSLGINYIPLLIYAIAITRRRSAVCGDG